MAKFDIGKAQASLNQKWAGDKWCPTCRQNKWTIPDDLVQAVGFEEGGAILGGPSYPLMMLICTNCGHTQFYNAVVMGLVAKK